MFIDEIAGQARNDKVNVMLNLIQHLINQQIPTFVRKTVLL